MTDRFFLRGGRAAAAVFISAALAACAGRPVARTVEPAPAAAPSTELYRTAAGPVRARPAMPLFLVDGVRWTWVLENGNLRLFSPAGRELLPDDIEMVQLLSGPTAVEEYGPAARNGVMLIRTIRVHQDAAAQ